MCDQPASFLSAKIRIGPLSSSPAFECLSFNFPPLLDFFIDFPSPYPGPCHYISYSTCWTKGEIFVWGPRSTFSMSTSYDVVIIQQFVSVAVRLFNTVLLASGSSLLAPTPADRFIISSFAYPEPRLFCWMSWCSIGLDGYVCYPGIFQLAYFSFLFERVVVTSKTSFPQIFFPCVRLEQEWAVSIYVLRRLWSPMPWSTRVCSLLRLWIMWFLIHSPNVNESQEGQSQE